MRFITLKRKKITKKSVLRLLLPHFAPIYHFKFVVFLTGAQEYFLTQGAGYLATPLLINSNLLQDSNNQPNVQTRNTIVSGSHIQLNQNYSLIVTMLGVAEL